MTPVRVTGRLGYVHRPRKGRWIGPPIYALVLDPEHGIVVVVQSERALFDLVPCEGHAVTLTAVLSQPIPRGLTHASAVMHAECADPGEHVLAALAR